MEYEKTIMAFECYHCKSTNIIPYLDDFDGFTCWCCNKTSLASDESGEVDEVWIKSCLVKDSDDPFDGLTIENGSRDRGD